MDQMDFEWVERPLSRNSEQFGVHEDDADSLGVISLEDSASEGCGTPSAAAAAVITALEDAGPFDQLQDIIQEAMASIHCVPASPAAVKQQGQAFESEGTTDSHTAASLQTTAGNGKRASSGEFNAAASHGIPAASSQDTTPTCTDNPNTSSKAPARNNSTLAVLLLLFGACAAAAIAMLLPLLLMRPASIAFPNTPTPAVPAKDALPLSPYARYTATAAVPTFPIGAARAAAGLSSNRTAAIAARSAAKGPQGAEQQPITAPVLVNMMLSCPKEWQCRYSKPQLAPWLAGASKATAASRVPQASAVANPSACQAAAAGGAQCPGKAANMQRQQQQQQ
ncbi:hypothetical protein OEZ85_007577 [Tetradesmus obliquus]|uniref:Uncharacterized protein n=1 Tax=Tetradesmus obliquus TaxID=3088 RepID=A0ABY8TGU3_TETOB|nr:hypothetical protein OEZ85_007577 [Tetradesmus obliquus]